MLDVNKPTDQELNAMWPWWIRYLSGVINALEAGTTDFITTELTVPGGSTALVVGTDLSLVKFETVLITGTAPSTIEQIRGGSQGQIKVFIFQNNNVSFNDGVKSVGELYLNQLPIDSDYDAQQDDVIALFNIDGDGSSEYGYWKEIWRQTSVK